MSPLPRITAEHALATPVVSSVVTSLAADATSPRAIRPWTHAGYTRWRRVGLQALAVAFVVGALLLAVAKQAGHPIGAPALLVPAGLSWVATVWALARRR